MTLARLNALRALMSSQQTVLAAYIIPTADAHNSEYISPCDARREWLTGFTGSAGTAVVTNNKALVWTDGRYYTQFEKEADVSVWTLMKQSLPDTPTIEKWLASNLPEGSVICVDPHTMSRETWTPILSTLLKAQMMLVATHENLVDAVRIQLGDPSPARPRNEVVPLEITYTGKPAGQKIKELRQKMSERKAEALVITALDEVAYTLNLRGSDIEYNPVFFSYLVVTPNKVTLFWSDGIISDAVARHLKEEGVEIEVMPYASVEQYLVDKTKELTQLGDSKPHIWVTSDGSEAIHRAACGGDITKKIVHLISDVSPVCLMKLYKNDVELEGFRACHVRDGVAVVRFLRWLHARVDTGDTTEIQAADTLLEFRKDESLFVGPSFETISGAGENGAVIHYKPTREGDVRAITKNDMYLVDSGGQYKDGTTDITRTRHTGTPTPAQRDAFTRVLKGQIMMGSALFPRGVKGNVLDTLARHSLWQAGLDYGHGTGHGVGHYLNVHEGPAGISWRPYPHDPGLRARQILSNEPGYYKVGEFGIRHEDLVETINVTKSTDHPRAATLLGDFEGRGVLGFNTLTLVPHQIECLDLSLMTEFEISYLNAYHARVLSTLGPILESRGLHEDKAWLERECRPITVQG